MSDYQSSQKKAKQPLEPLDPKKFQQVREKHKIDPNVFDIICRDICRGASHDQLDKFCYQCAKLQLDPALGQIHFIPKWDRDNNFTPITAVGIEGQRSIADRTGLYAGSEETVFHYQLEGENETRKGPVFPEGSVCIAATITVQRTAVGHPEIKYPFTSTAFLRDYVVKNYEGQVSSMWRKVGIMLPKVAEAGALRKAFPSQLGPLYIPEEVSQTDDKEEARAPEAPQPAKEPAPSQESSEGHSEKQKDKAPDVGSGAQPVEAPKGVDSSSQPQTATATEPSVKQMSQILLEALRDKYKEQTGPKLQAYICKLQGVDRLEKVPIAEQGNVIKILYMAYRFNGVQHVIGMVEEKLNGPAAS